MGIRSIEFRGKRESDGIWYYGVPLVFTEDYVCMTAPHTYNKKVEANTVGQYTGLCDKNGTRIFEGDIVMKRSNYSGNTIIAVVTYSDACFLAMVNNNSGFGLDESNNLEVIGNIYDNPELLEGAEK